MTEHIQQLIIREQFEELEKGLALELKEWRDRSAENNKSYEDFLSLIDDYSLATRYYAIDIDLAWKSVNQRISTVKSNKSFFSFSPYWIAAACLLLITFFGGLFFYIGQQAKEQTVISEIMNKKGGSQQHATLTMADGRVLDLGMEKGELKTSEGHGMAVNNDGVLQMTAPESTAMFQWVEVSVPNGSLYKLRLEDGSNVVLNSGSKLRYPIAFNKKERIVELEGEAYFDVKHDGDRLFSVKTKESSTEVLGTAFNIDSYKSEHEEITLVRGKVRVAHMADTYILKPGNQLHIGQQKINLLQDVELSHYTSWIEGTLRFDDMELKDIIHKVERWYNVSFSFKDKTAERLHFTGAVDKDSPLGDFLKKLEQMTNVRFNYKNNTVEVYRK